MMRRRCLSAVLGIAAAWLSGCDDDDESCPDAVGVACVWAGTGKAGFDGDGQTPRDSNLYWPVDVTFTSGGDAYLMDWNNHKVRWVNEGGELQTVIGTDFVGDGDFAMADLEAPGVMGTEISLNHPTQLLEAPDGGLLLISWHNHKLRHFDPATGMVYVSCGRGAGYEGDGGPADDPATRLNQPAGGVFGPDGSLYLLDQRNQRIRHIDADGIIHTVAGTGEPGYGGDGGSPMAAQFSFPTGSNPPPAGTLTLDDEGRLYIADTLNHRIRRIDFANDTIETVAGNGEATFGGDGGPAVDASLSNPRDLAMGPDGRLYVADEHNHRVRVIDLDSGIIDTVVGTSDTGFGEDGRLATETTLARPSGVAFDGDGRLYVADTYNHVIRRIRLQETER